MATDDPITVYEGNDTTVTVTVTPADAGDDLTDVASLEFYLKHTACDADDAATTVVLTTADPAEVLITAQTADGITAEVYVPGTALEEPFGRTYRVDAIGAGGGRRTAVYGTVTVVDV